MKQRESVKLRKSAKNTKQTPRDDHQRRYSPYLFALLTTNSLELKLALTAINEHTITHEHILFRT